MLTSFLSRPSRAKSSLSTCSQSISKLYLSHASYFRNHRSLIEFVASECQHPYACSSRYSFSRFCSTVSSGDNSNPIKSSKDAYAGRNMSAETELLKEIKSRINTKGPISLSEFMSLALGHPKYGYYGAREHIFGSKGDFITSPEISQLFGEMITIWLVSMWMKLGEPESFKLVELGPGRGILMSDIIRSAKRFPKFFKSISGIHLVETSKKLREVQKKALESSGKSIRWADQFTDIFQESSIIGAKKNKSEPILIVAQELFDALPVYQFEYTNNGWREILIDTADKPNIAPEDIPKPDHEGLNHHLRFVLAYGETLPSRYFMQNHQKQSNEKFPLGTRIEIAHAAQALAYEIGKRISENRGCALIIDYGTDSKIIDNSLRGIQNHKFVHPLKEPGNVDLSVDVQFSSIKDFALLGGSAINTSKKEKIEKKKSGGLFASGPMTQSDFLRSMGIELRVQRLLQSIPDDDVKTLNAVYSGYKRLIEKDEMGEIYKALILSSEKISDI